MTKNAARLDKTRAAIVPRLSKGVLEFPGGGGARALSSISVKWACVREGCHSLYRGWHTWDRRRTSSFTPDISQWVWDKWFPAKYSLSHCFRGKCNEAVRDHGRGFPIANNLRSRHDRKQLLILLWMLLSALKKCCSSVYTFRRTSKLEKPPGVDLFWHPIILLTTPHVHNVTSALQLRGFKTPTSDTHSSRGLRTVLNVAKVRMFPRCVSHRLRDGMGEVSMTL